MWCRKFDRCQNCGSTEHEHVGKGLCSVCYYRQYKVHNIDKIKQNKRNWYYGKHQERLQNSKLRREEQHFSGLRDIVLERDQYKCCRCGNTQTLVVHHIDGNGRGVTYPNNTLDNLQTLCRKCHFLCHQYPDQFIHPPTPKLNKHGKWHNKYDACICCGTVYSEYTARGLCNACYVGKRAKGELVTTPRVLTDEPKLAKNGKWSFKYDSCIYCHKTTSKHAARGICTRCYPKRKQQEEIV